MTLMPVPVASSDKKVMLHCILIMLTQGMQWCHWECHWCHATLILMPVALHDWKKSCCSSFWSLWPKKCKRAIDKTVDTMPVWVPLLSHDQKVMLPLILIIFVRKLVVLLVMLSTWHDADTNAVASHDGNTNAGGIMWYKCWCQWHHMTKNACCTSFQLSLT